MVLGDHSSATAQVVTDSVATFASHTHNAYNLATGDLSFEMVVPQCARQACGDQIYRSTLDAELRKEVKELTTPGGLAILSLILAYLSLPPRVGSGAIDYYLLAPLQRAMQPRVSRDDFAISKTLGKGGFGTVYLATATRDIKDRYGKTVFAQGSNLIAKEAREYGSAEKWMNERTRRAARPYVASYQGSFCEDETVRASNSGLSGSDEPPLWLLWDYETDETLRSVLESKDFPYNLEEAFLGESYEGTLPRGPARALLTHRVICRQILEALAALHATGIVHRDIKPENIILDRGDEPGAARLKMIDLGAAADLKTGRNYVPREYLLDPRYAPPEEYVMSTQTAEPPPEPIAALLSPVLWQLNLPDRFDMYSVGILFMQIACPNLRSDSSLNSFRRALETENYSVRSWRETVTKRAAQGGGSVAAPLNASSFFKAIGLNFGGTTSTADEVATVEVPEEAASTEMRVVPKGFEEGFAVLDASPDGRADSTLWYVVRKLVREDPQTRESSSRALSAPFFSSKNSFAPSAAAMSVLSSASAASTSSSDSDSSNLSKAPASPIKGGTARLVFTSPDAADEEEAEQGEAAGALRWMGNVMARAGTAESDGFTEAEMQALYEAQQMERLSSKASSNTPSVSVASEFLGKSVQASIAGRLERGESLPAAQRRQQEKSASANPSGVVAEAGVGVGGVSSGKSNLRGGLRSSLIGLGLGSLILGKSDSEVALDAQTKAARR